MDKNGHSEFFPTIFPKKTGTNLEWPKMAIPNVFQQKCPKMAIPNLFKHFWYKKTGKIWNCQKWVF